MLSYQRIDNSFQMGTAYYSQYVSILFNQPSYFVYISFIIFKLSSRLPNTHYIFVNVVSVLICLFCIVVNSHSF